MKIGELAARLKVAPSKIRFLEAQGLIRPVRRTANGYREYDQSTVEALQIILQAQSFGFSLEEMKRAFVETRGQGLRCEYIIAKLTSKLNELDRHIEQARALRGSVTAMIDQLEIRRAGNQHATPRGGPSQTIDDRPVAVAPLGRGSVARAVRGRR
jgi:MerR family copper efflux transcriptional regulator